MTGLKPASCNAMNVWLPMYPAPPVRRMVGRRECDMAGTISTEPQVDVRWTGSDADHVGDLPAHPAPRASEAPGRIGHTFRRRPARWRRAGFEAPDPLRACAMRRPAMLRLRSRTRCRH